MHDHDHNHSIHSEEEALALLQYMAHHNHHHAQELHDLSHQFTGEAAELLHQAYHQYEQGNQLVEKALGLLKKD